MNFVLRIYLLQVQIEIGGKFDCGLSGSGFMDSAEPTEDLIGR